MFLLLSKALSVLQQPYNIEEMYLEIPNQFTFFAHCNLVVW